MYSLTQDRHSVWIKISPMRAGGKMGENFLLVKISGYVVYNRSE